MPDYVYIFLFISLFSYFTYEYISGWGISKSLRRHIIVSISEVVSSCLKEYIKVSGCDRLEEVTKVNETYPSDVRVNR